MQIRNLQQNELDGLAYYRTWVNDILNRGFGIGYSLSGTKDDIPYLDTVLGGGPYSDEPANELIIIGSVMGDAIADTLSMEWVVYADEKSSDFALAHRTKQVFTFPQDMLSKRAESGTLGTISELFDATIETLQAEILFASDRAQ